MSKSLGNTIHLSDTADDVRKKVMSMYTDPEARPRRHPRHGRRESGVHVYHDAFNPNREEVDDLKERYRAGKVGDVEVKTKLAAALNAHLDPIRERRAAVLARPDHLKEILFEGSRARPRRGAGDDGAGEGRGEDFVSTMNGRTARLRIGRRRLSRQARELRRPARSAASPHQEERGEHLRHSDRADHRSSISTRST